MKLAEPQNFSPIYQNPQTNNQGNLYFITLRLDFPLPNQYYEALDAEQKRLRNTMQLMPGDGDRNLNYKKRLFAFTDHYLDCLNCPHNILHTPRLAQFVIDELIYMDRRYYNLLAFTVMPNHVHFVCRIMPDWSGEPYNLDSIMDTLQKRTAKLLNIELKRYGPLWENNYDVYPIQQEDELQRVVQYILTNPVKGGLVEQPLDWTWTWLSPELNQQLAITN